MVDSFIQDTISEQNDLIDLIRQQLDLFSFQSGIQFLNIQRKSFFDSQILSNADLILIYLLYSRRLSNTTSSDPLNAVSEVGA